MIAWMDHVVYQHSHMITQLMNHVIRQQGHMTTL
jgi:hypothetical protein